MKRLVLFAFLVSLLPSLNAATLAASNGTMALPNCVGKPEVRPTEVVITCADAGITARKLRWTGWGEPFAAALGTMSVNDCKPYCAAGHFHNYSVIVVASGKQRCPDGTAAYRTVTYAYVGKGPENGSPTMDFPCKPRH